MKTLQIYFVLAFVSFAIGYALSGCGGEPFDATTITKDAAIETADAAHPDAGTDAPTESAADAPPACAPDMIEDVCGACPDGFHPVSLTPTAQPCPFSVLRDCARDCPPTYTVCCPLGWLAEGCCHGWSSIGDTYSPDCGGPDSQRANGTNAFTCEVSL
ncbi:MAG: hypothetical protein KC776_28850 [Myxococcales bacterium]|nr:hypothetical protein [Myxococcales bacterium]MCB9580965.1 hypothetical protein [Polyangiaceae bacterium]